MAVDLRLARASDVDALLAIEEDTFPTDRLSRRSFRRLISSSSARVIVAEKAGRMAGYCIVLAKAGGSGARLYSVATAPVFSGLGIGQSLIAAAEREARAMGRSSLKLEVRQDNRRAIAIYEQAGFHQTGVERDYYEDGMTAIRMTKALSGTATLKGKRTLFGTMDKASMRTLQ